jgi:superfamily I DNA/RNA helicase
MEKFNPSPYQQKIFDFVKSNPSSNLVINALAGSGKTTTLEKLLEHLPKVSTIFCAFNKSIVNEISEKLKTQQAGRSYHDRLDVKTMHSFGYSAIRKKFGSVIVNDNKVYEHIDKVFEKWNIPQEIQEGYKSRVRSLVNIAKLSLCKNTQELYERAEHYSIEIFNSEVEKAWEVLLETRKDTKVIDMTDMIYYPVLYKINVGKYKLVLVDECQDLNRCQQELMKMMIDSGGRFIAVGDPRQAIYGFAGADEESFKRLSEIPNTSILPLSVNYRCGKSILAAVKHIVPEIQASEFADEGNVIENAVTNDLVDGDFVICRNVRPLVKLCLELLSTERKAFLKGKDIGKNLVNMLKKTKKENFEEAVKVLESELFMIMKKSMALGKTEEQAMSSGTYQTYLDKLGAIQTIGGNVYRTANVIAKIESMFDDEKSGIALSTIHKAKGLESERVFILSPELMPSPWATRDWEILQEQNLEYVAITRAKKTLGFIRNYGK